MSVPPDPFEMDAENQETEHPPDEPFQAAIRYLVELGKRRLARRAAEAEAES